MSESKAKEARTIPPHVHCHECGRAIAPEDALRGAAIMPKMLPDRRVAFAPRPVPLCGDCWERIHAAEQKPQVQVPKLVLPNGVRPS